MLFYFTKNFIFFKILLSDLLNGIFDITPIHQLDFALDTKYDVKLPVWCITYYAVIKFFTYYAIKKFLTIIF